MNRDLLVWIRSFITSLPSAYEVMVIQTFPFVFHQRLFVVRCKHFNNRLFLKIFLSPPDSVCQVILQYLFLFRTFFLSRDKLWRSVGWKAISIWQPIKPGLKALEFKINEIQNGSKMRTECKRWRLWSVVYMQIWNTPTASVTTNIIHNYNTHCLLHLRGN